MRPTELDIPSVLAFLALPICAVLLVVGLKLIVTPWREKRKKARKQKALRDAKIILRRM